jgi:hypothetical protein
LIRAGTVFEDPRGGKATLTACFAVRRRAANVALFAGTRKPRIRGLIKRANRLTGHDALNSMENCLGSPVSR